jgi:hypothetical protein
VLRPEVFRLPKAGSTRSEYEDAVAWSASQARFAVTDGASASAFARLWALLLANGYTAGWLGQHTLEVDLEQIQDRWANLVERRALPWYAAEQARRGAFAALVGVSLAADRTWTALAIGDCCVFQVRADRLLEAFPVSDPRAFDNRPFLVGSRASANRSLRECGAIGTRTGSWEYGDTFLLMSDALAAAFLTLYSQVSGVQPVSPLAVLDFTRTPSGFKRWVQELRAERVLRNDDVSLLWLTVDTRAFP